MTKPKRKIVHVPGVHWTKVPENKEILRQIRLEGARTLDKKRRDAGWVAKQPGRKNQHKSKTLGAKQAANKLAHERELRRARDKKYRQNRTKTNQETIGNDQEEINQIEQARIKQASIEEVARICYAKCETWISTYADFNGISESAVAKWVGRSLVAKASR